MVERLEGTLLSLRGGVYRVFTDAGSIEASLRGKLKQEGHAQLVVGDIVRLQVQQDGSYTVEGRLERRNVLRRRTPGRTKGVRMIASNIDQILVVASVQRPEWDHQLTDRFLAVSEANHIPPVLVINKADLDADADSLSVPYRRAGYQVLVTSIKTGQGVLELRSLVERRTSLFTGSTGVGKSSLVNAIEPELAVRIGEISEKAQVGRHTTVSAEMYPLSVGGFVVDTPGLRDVGLWALDPTEVVAAFPDFSEYAAHCRFDDCRHLQEPDCAVIAACEKGEIAETRLSSYRKFLEEARQASRHWE